MPKQPKFFYSSQTPQTPKKAQSEPLAQPISSAKESSAVSLRFPRVKLPQAGKRTFFSFGVLLLGLVTALGVFSAGQGNFRISIQPALAMILPKRSEASLVAQNSSGPLQGVTFDIRSGDGRVEIVRSFLERHNSPLKPSEHYAQELVKAADLYGLDYRLLPAIMMQESNLCKNSDPTLHNCLGFGIHARGTLGFESYEASFDRAARELKERYIDIGLVTPEQIMTKYTPSSNGSWANSVNQWIAEMEFNSREKGRTDKTNANLLQYVTEPKQPITN